MLTRRRPGMSLADSLAWWGVPSSPTDACVRAINVRSRRDGYYCIRWQGHPELLHRLVLTSVLGRPIGDGLVARHRCGHSWCINPAHLGEGTHLDNMRDQYVHGTRVSGDRHPQSRLSEDQVTAIRSAEGSTHAAIAQRFGVSRQTVTDIRLGRRHQQLARAC